MQKLAPVSADRNPNQHTEAEVLAALRGTLGARKFTFRYDLLSSANVKQAGLTGVLDCTVEQNWLADVKRKASFTIRDTGLINYLQDRIQPWVRLWLPPYGTSDFVEWPQGVFLLTSPVRKVGRLEVVTRDVEGYDPLQVFAEELMTTRYTVAAGVVYTTQISTLLGSIPKQVETSAKTLPAAREWDPGTSKLAIINDLLTAINYESLSFDEDGMAIVQSYRSPAVRPAQYDYADDQDSVMLPDTEQELDVFGVANQWTLTVSEPDRPALTATYTNTDPSSPTSTVNRQRTIGIFETSVDAVDLTTLQARAARLAFEASQVFEAITFETAMMPMHSGNDVYTIRRAALAVNDKYGEHTWSMNLRAGAKMSHRARRVVTV